MTKRTPEQAIRDGISYTTNVLAVCELRLSRAQERAHIAAEGVTDAAGRVRVERGALRSLEAALVALVGPEAADELLDPEGEDDGSSES